MPKSRAALRWTLLAASLVGYLAALPYALHLQAGALAEAPIPPAALVPLQFLVAGVVYYGIISLSLRLLPSTPYRLLLEPQQVRVAGAWRGVLLWGMGGALAAAGAIALADIATRPFVGELPFALTKHPPLWKGALASLYGGITEEVLLRLFVMTGVTALALRVPVLGRRPSLAVWGAVLLAALVFALGHLPAVPALGVEVTPAIVLRIVALNSVAGIVFGWLFAHRNFETAVVAHGLTDIVLHVVVPALS